ncbi:hypothetical protein KCG48_13270 [Proteiniclasticum sp. BAD-10]|uniref:Uncharacterized protein n=1 Tax=Proteiniclasticum sediminis TaxID=2804028 RepID=A0A941CSF0_9CLOT|nr:hypothetical protein [Proteiniclasticum sediminis]MBR0577284.1 hypothetical protein [Proteiniclasticum sediminis]
MMISPEGYYEEYLKGKTEAQIMSAIRGLKQEIGRLKNTMESPEYGQDEIVHPSEDTRLHWTREYLERAKQAYAEAGGTYTLSKSEEKATDFDSKMDFISKITFSIGGFFGGYRSYVVELSDEFKAYTKLWDDEEPLVLLDENNEPFKKETYIAALTDLHIGEWRRRYSTRRFGYTVCDGTQWELEFEYNNGHKPVRFDGDNSYPYNFDKFQMLFGIDETEEDDDE